MIKQTKSKNKKDSIIINILYLVQRGFLNQIKANESVLEVFVVMMNEGGGCNFVVVDVVKMIWRLVEKSNKIEYI